MVSIKRAKTPRQDQPVTSRAYPNQIRPGGPANPVFGGGAVGNARGRDSHPVFGDHGFSQAKRMDTSQDPREWLE